MKCKKCNVSLAPYLSICPLCGTKVKQTHEENIYSNRIEELSTKVNLLYFSKALIKVLLLTNIICIICNLAINKTLSWSYYVLSSSLYLSSFFLYLILNNKISAFLLNMVSLEILLFTISWLTNTTSWFLYLVGPFILLIILYVLLNIYLSKYKNILRNFSCILTYISFCLFVINGCIRLYKTNIFEVTWSIYSNIPILTISLLLMILSFNKKITDEIEKRFFI